MTSVGGSVTRIARVFGLRGPKIMLVAQAIWFITVVLLVAWWGHVISSKAEEIAALQARLGALPETTTEMLRRTHRMIFWEGLTFLSLLMASTAFLTWVYWRDYLRAKAIHAFFASLTHELRTPLTSIRLQAEAIAEAVGAEQSPLVGRLLEDTMRLESQVERTLELARVEGGGPVFVQPIPLRLWLDRFIGNWKNSGNGKIQIEAKLGEEATVMADPAAVQVIFRNLLENSARHSGVHEEKGVKATVTSEVRNGTVVLRYRDNGKGYDGNRRNLGKIFHKGAASQGAGVGLYLMRVLMERMGGEAIFEPGPGFGVALIFREGSRDG